ncbi:hypothetical protein HBB16_06800 [Pseudonocardia sp. MCCB 268]|nr:hypothetical protein [Pseudonocardia cytotoxica]
MRIFCPAMVVGRPLLPAAGLRGVGPLTARRELRRGCGRLRPVLCSGLVGWRIRAPSSLGTRPAGLSVHEVRRVAPTRILPGSPRPSLGRACRWVSPAPSPWRTAKPRLTTSMARGARHLDYRCSPGTGQRFHAPCSSYNPSG